MKFVYNSDWNLDILKDYNKKMIDGEEYVLSDVKSQNYKGWKILCGKMYEIETKGSAKYALAISPGEYKKLMKRISEVK